MLLLLCSFKDNAYLVMKNNVISAVTHLTILAVMFLMMQVLVDVVSSFSSRRAENTLMLPVMPLFCCTTRVMSTSLGVVGEWNYGEGERNDDRR